MIYEIKFIIYAQFNKSGSFFSGSFFASGSRTFFLKTLKLYQQLIFGKPKHFLTEFFQSENIYLLGSRKWYLSIRKHKINLYFGEKK